MTTHDYIGQLGDFDFLVGTWQVSNRCLRRRNEGSSDWDTFEATSQGWSLLDGGMSVDEIRFPSKGFTGATVRTLDHATRRWSIYWASSKTGHLYPPVHGGFSGDRGEFYGEDMDDGRRVAVRFIWLRGRDEARWEQAFSLDGEKWETNWVMAFRRTS